MKLSDPNKKRLGRYLQSIRQDAEKSQGDLAKAMKLASNQHVSNVERGKSTASMDFLKVYQRTCKVNKSEFITEIQKLYVDEIRESLR